jgi:hypothetical protein
MKHRFLWFIHLPLLLMFFCSSLSAQSFDPALIYKLCKECKAGNQKSCSELEKAAVKQTNPVDVRRGAIACISDQDALFKAASKDLVRDNRLFAISRLTDQQVLNSIVLKEQDQQIRIAAVNNMTDQALLLSIAMNDIDFSVRKEAITRVNGNDALLKIINNEDNDTIREVALRKLDNEAVCLALYQTSKSVDRKFLIPKINDIIFLEKVALDTTDNPESRGAAIGKISSQSLLEKLATSDRYWYVRKSATQNLADQQLLAKIAVSDESHNTRAAAASNLIDQKLLAKIAVDDNSWDVRLAAVKNIHDNTILKLIVKDDNEYDTVRLEALKNVTDEKFLAYITETHYYYGGFGPVAIRKISDPLVSAELYKSFIINKEGEDDDRLLILYTDKTLARIYPDLKVTRKSKKSTVSYENNYYFVTWDQYVEITNGITTLFRKTYKGSTGDIVEVFTEGEKRKESYAEIDVPEVFSSVLKPLSQEDLHLVASQSGIYDLRAAALKLITDKKFIAETAKKDTVHNVRLEALYQLDDPLDIEYFAINDKNPTVRKYAVHLINNPEMLMHIAANPSDSSVRIAAINKINDQKFLIDLYKAGNEIDIREAIIRQLTDIKFLNYIIEKSGGSYLQILAANRLQELTK